jgi:hypothetical protein
MGGQMNEVSDYIGKHISPDNKNEFEASLYRELVKRLGELRQTTGIQIPLSTWKTWIMPGLTVLAILCVYLFWIVPQF